MLGQSLGLADPGFSAGAGSRVQGGFGHIPFCLWVLVSSVLICLTRGLGLTVSAFEPLDGNSGRQRLELSCA